MGFNDRAAKHIGRYATYKLALGILAACKLVQRPKVFDAALERLLDLQGKAGGWITDYDADGKPLGLANVETTSLAILAIDRCVKS